MAKFWSENFKRRKRLVGLGVDWRITLRLILEKLGGKVWTKCKWLRIGSSGGLS
jgi:hypothetical protein